MQASTMPLNLTAAVSVRRNEEPSLDRSISSEDKDLQLVRRIAAGDETALRALFAAYGQRLFAYAVRLTRNPSVAEDVLQESLVAAWRGAARFRGQGRVVAWLLGIVHHKALNALRSKSPVLLEEPEELGDDQVPLDEVMAEHEQAALLRVGLESLSLKHRMVLELVFYQGLDLTEVALVCDCPVGTVKSRLSYAKAHLRHILEQSGLKAEDLE